MNLPNKLTVLRILLAPVFLVLMMVDFPFHYL
ncbi:MAG: CDP-diacylglycerol--glycerol-3-phosphate 3-phosphatidyltransferase, partial [Clostridiales bacterium]|nr:CDP-diacylglycerol--glycerol-3-phosphate 3-phosphatidyltransferase [Clostridiales bacterium]